MKQAVAKSAYMLSGTIFILGLIILASLSVYILGYSNTFCLPGEFLFTAFLWTALFVPVYLITLSMFIISRPFQKRNVLILTLFILPFATASIFQKIMLDSRIPPSFLPDLLVKSFGRIPSAMLLFLMILLELMLIYKISVSTSKKKKEEEPEILDPIETRLLNSPESAVEKQTEKPYKEKIVPIEKAVLPKAALPKAVLPEKKVRVEDAEFEESEYIIPISGLLKDYEDGRYWEIDDETRRSGKTLMATLEEFKIQAEVTGIRKGPVITMFEILPAPGVKISKIVNLADNIALRLAASRVRIVAPIPGKHAVGIEVPNKKRSIVSFKEMVSLENFQKSKFEIPIALGKDIAGDAQIVDLTQTPHLLIAGATGSGKSVCVNSIICSILYKKSPDDVRFLLIDPKIVELKAYNDIPHLLTPVVTEPKKTFQALQYCLVEMERRYSLLDALGVRDIHSYNRKAPKEKVTISKLPYWVIVIDEFADLIATTGKEMEATLARMAAMARAVGMHLVLATQRPSIDVITGLIKANIPSRIAFMVAGKFDSRIIIDSVGAEKLLGRGDMLFSAAWDPVPVRTQGAFLSDEEVEAITDYARSLGEPDYLDDEIFFDDEEENFRSDVSNDPLMDNALEIILAAGKASASYLQRRLKIGYNRAARIIEEMEMRGIVGPPNGSKPREILHVPER